ncbi:hypothetical protein GGX14DRAFT_384322 [Mycena pura]|uniref:Uncharacterized protein n=1 Tax=Mycena pura TaxID=153505 RepID=A0AAD6YV30_9AGAR|nr:hypothetical protein GGX14DRAFT_384322 [Mycena pura]
MISLPKRPALTDCLGCAAAGPPDSEGLAVGTDAGQGALLLKDESSVRHSSPRQWRRPSRDRAGRVQASGHCARTERRCTVVADGQPCGGVPGRAGVFASCRTQSWSSASRYKRNACPPARLHDRPEYYRMNDGFCRVLEFLARLAERTLNQKTAQRFVITSLKASRPQGLKLKLKDTLKVAGICVASWWQSRIVILFIYTIWN